MTTAEALPTREPADVVRERLNDPAVAAALVTVLDNADLLSTLVLGVSGFLERGDTIMDSVAASVNELRAVGEAARGANGSEPLPSRAALTNLAAALTRTTPLITDVLNSSMASHDTISLLGLFSDAATEGAAIARQNESTVHGLRSTIKLLKDPEVGRGLGLMVEIAKALGRRLDAAPATTSS